VKQVEQVEQGDAFAFNLLGSGLTCMSATALMEVERATPPGFEEEILKPPEVKEDLDEGMVNVPIETKEVVVNINRVLESDITNGVTKDSANPKKEEEEEEGEEEEEEKKKSAVVLNGSSESILNGDDHDQDDSRLHSDEIKKEDDMITCEEKVKADITPSEEEGMVVEEVKEEEEENGEAMEQDTSRDPEPTPEPPEPPEDKGPKLEKAIYEEEIVDGFNFCSFETYPEVEECAKWIRDYGKYPDPWYKLKFKPKEPKPEKKPKEKKEKKEKVKKEPKMKASIGSATDKGYICDIESDGDKKCEGLLQCLERCTVFWWLPRRAILIGWQQSLTLVRLESMLPMRVRSLLYRWRPPMVKMGWCLFS